jgi:hypothetical protein
MAMSDLLKLFTLAAPVGGKSRHATKVGPGRISPSRHTTGPKRLAPTVGGNWQGKPYLSYAEHDACMRAELDARTLGWAKGQGYAVAQNNFFDRR